MNFKQLGGTDESGLAISNGGETERLSLGSIDSNRKYSTSSERKFLLVAGAAVVVVVDEQ